MEGYLAKATEKQYAQRSGTLSIDENGTLLQQTLSFDVSYEIDGHTLHCTHKGISFCKKSPACAGLFCCALPMSGYANKPMKKVARMSSGKTRRKYHFIQVCTRSPLPVFASA